MAWYLILSEKGIRTTPVQAADATALSTILAAETGNAVAIPLPGIVDVGPDGQVPASYTTSQTNWASLVTKAQNALNTNATFLALASPTNAQIASQVNALTRECSALIRLLLAQLDTTSGT